MRTLLLISLLLSTKTVLAQSDNDDNSNFKLLLSYGKVNSFMGNTGEIDFHICDLPQCSYDRSYFKTVPTNYFDFVIMYRINKKNSIGGGFIATQHGKRQVLSKDGKAVLYMDYLFDYYGFKIRYQKDFLFSNRFKLGIANSLEFEYLTQMQYNVRDLYPKGKSWASQLVLGFSITKHFMLDLSFVYKLALEDYGPTSWIGEFRRTGSGILLGISYGF